MVSAARSLEPFVFTVEQYHAMRDADILGEDDHVELLDGILVPKMTKKPPHRLVTGLVRAALEQLVPEGYYVDSQEPITTDDSEPEPDVLIVRGASRDYSDRHPGPSDVPLVIEVADDSIGRDKEIKRPMYARAGIAQYWIVDVQARVVEIYRDPRADEYETKGRAGESEELMVEFDGKVLGRISVEALLP